MMIISYLPAFSLLFIVLSRKCAAFSWGVSPPRCLKHNRLLEKSRFLSLLKAVGHENANSPNLPFNLPINDDVDRSKEISEQSDDYLTIKRTVLNICEIYSDKGEFETIDPQILTDNARVLCRGRLYETVVSDLIRLGRNLTSSSQLHQVDSFLSGFISSERKSRSRLKVNYLLAGVASNRFEEGVQKLLLNKEIDEHLLSFLRQLIKMEEKRLGNQESVAIIPDDLNTLSISIKSGEISPQALPIMRMILRRLKAELLMESNQNFKLLSFLARSEPRERPHFLKGQFNRLEDLQSFFEYAKSALDFVEKNDGYGGQGKDKVQLSARTIEVLRDIVLDIDLLLRGMQEENDIYVSATDS